MELVPLFGIFFGNISFALMLLVWWKLRQRKLELQADVQAKLIDKFTSTPEMVSFLQSSAGRDFVNATQIGATAQSREQLLTGLRRGIILLVLSGGFAALWAVFGDREWSIPTILCFALGAGFVLATVASLAAGRRIGMTLDDASRES
jgi:hypothetical protein